MVHIKTAAAKRGAHPSHPKRRPVTLEHLFALCEGLRMSNAFDVAVWAVALHFGGAESAQFHIPWAKMEHQEGADLIFTSREDLCPVEALCAHLKSNKDVPDNAPLFAFKTSDSSWAPMTKEWFLDRCRKIWELLNLDFIHGHSFRPGGATELLLAGVPPETVAKQGHWKSLAFLIYWRKLEDLIPAMIMKSYNPTHIAELKNSFEQFRIRHLLACIHIHRIMYSHC
ncbi:uncharacterized protein EV420DRAFT_1702088 [Desarmillaria tabescens]|uniref:Tyr recombinase domain-containing protein n=1 Tax=Armillaria tabescens TaxID=1929756 RepID=A0AA39K026_ARMTA|nr:uncharacterized protein EV420DRAFT_1702088 [Desarmillaria tabescens]KAK0451979.1 hypothetical protein EV420DRAFT_1702088 [Desarmillaria tabescens]